MYVVRRNLENWSTSLRDTPSPTSPLAPPYFGFGSPPPEKESLPSSFPSRLEKSSTCFARHARVERFHNQLEDSTMYALILLACCLAAWPIHIFVARPVARMLGLID